MHKSFYRAFEDRYRGSRQLIRSRLEAYAPFAKPFLMAERGSAERPRALDLGCGRGEWVELLRDWGFDAHGVDLDEGMLEACRDIGLQVTRGDALDCLQALPDGSQAIVSAFHVVEHIPFSSLEQLVTESLRVLQPGGLLVLETPNPESLIVGTELFYLDPTHAQPIPHLLLSFLLKHCGFHRVKVLPLQEPKGIRDKEDPGLLDVIASVSPDYGAIGQKLAPVVDSVAWDEAFDTAYGQGLLDLASRFDNAQVRQAGAINSQLDRMSHEISLLSNGLQQSNNAHAHHLQEMELHIDQVTRSLRSVEERLGENLQEAHRQALRAIQAQHEAERQQLLTEFRHQDMARSQKLVLIQQQLAAANEQAHQLHLHVQALNLHVQALHHSTSWRLTAPVRWLSRRLRPNRHTSATQGNVAAASKAAELSMEISSREAVSQPADILPATPMTPTGKEVYLSLQAACTKNSSC